MNSIIASTRLNGEIMSMPRSFFSGPIFDGLGDAVLPIESTSRKSIERLIKLKIAMVWCKVGGYIFQV